MTRIVNGYDEQFAYSEQQELIEAIEKAVVELQGARNFFQTVDDPKLIDCAIYLERAAQAKYIYLLDQAKKMNVKITHEPNYSREESM
jgi:hypothetical protein